MDSGLTCVKIGWKCIKIGSAAIANIVHVAPWMIAAYLAVHPIPADCWKDCHFVIPSEEFRPGGMFGPGPHLPPPDNQADLLPPSDALPPGDTTIQFFPLPPPIESGTPPGPGGFTFGYPPIPIFGGGPPPGPGGNTFGYPPLPPTGGGFPPPPPTFTLAGPIPPLMPSQPPVPAAGTGGRDIPRFLPPPTQTVASIAEPRSAALLLAGLGGLFLVRRAAALNRSAAARARVRPRRTGSGWC
jgi:hypothetical protein